MAPVCHQLKSPVPSGAAGASLLQHTLLPRQARERKDFPEFFFPPVKLVAELPFCGTVHCPQHPAPPCPEPGRALLVEVCAV